ncbi:MAG: hypothetical protein ACRDJW_20240 [Thermomicrobiales bacterium]
MIYCATERAAAFAETIARFRPAVRVIAGLAEIDDPEPVAIGLQGLVDPEAPSRGVVPADWRLGRRLAETVLDPNLRFVDIASARTLHQLRQELASTATRLSLSDVDLSAVTGSHRRLTQACARYIYDQMDQSGQPRYAGVRYLSRLHGAWECWAVFANRMRHSPGMPVSIFPNDPGLLEAAAVFGLSIESFEGHYLRPWR